MIGDLKLTKYWIHFKYETRKVLFLQQGTKQVCHCRRNEYLLTVENEKYILSNKCYILIAFEILTSGYNQKSGWFTVKSPLMY